MFSPEKQNLLFVVNDLNDISLNRAILTLARKINKNQFNISLISLSSGGQLIHLFRSIKRLKLTINHNLIEGLTRVSKCLLGGNNLIVHTQTLRADLVVFLARLVTVFCRHRVTHICVRRNYLFSEENFWHRIKNMLYFLSCHLADMNVCVAKHLEQKLISQLKVPRNKIITIVNGVNVKKHRPLNPKEVPQIIFTGRLIARKNVIALLRAINKIPQPLKCLVIGDGEDSPKLKNYCRLSGIQNQVEFLGHKPNVAPYLSKSDIYVLPSLDEGLSWSLLEAMSHGLACVVSDADGNVELIKNGYNGLVFQLGGGAEGLTKCLMNFLVNVKLRQKLGANAQRTIRENYSEPAMITSYQNLYLKLANFDNATSAVTEAR